MVFLLYTVSFAFGKSPSKNEHYFVAIYIEDGADA